MRTVYALFQAQAASRATRIPTLRNAITEPRGKLSKRCEPSLSSTGTLKRLLPSFLLTADALRSPLLCRTPWPLAVAHPAAVTATRAQRVKTNAGGWVVWSGRFSPERSAGS